MNFINKPDLLSEHVVRQLKSLFKIPKQEIDLLNREIEILTKKELPHHFSSVKNKYYNSNGKAYLSPLHSGHYFITLYKISHRLSLTAPELADKIYILNKMISSCDVYHAVKLPVLFFAEHPVGSVMGRATYGERFVFQQNCTVGGNKGRYPEIGNDVRMFANAMILGNSQIGDKVFIGAGTIVKDQNIPSNSIVFGQSPKLIIKQKEPEYFFSKSIFRL